MHEYQKIIRGVIQCICIGKTWGDLNNKNITGALWPLGSCCLLRDGCWFSAVFRAKFDTGTNLELYQSQHFKEETLLDVEKGVEVIESMIHAMFRDRKSWSDLITAPWEGKVAEGWDGMSDWWLWQCALWRVSGHTERQWHQEQSPSVTRNTLMWSDFRALQGTERCWIL